ncbi:MAG: cysteine hydrolase [Chloroflexi bacterium]|nr:MAG: cysteine hydrolase [Chloroflexota bacterium]
MAMPANRTSRPMVRKEAATDEATHRISRSQRLQVSDERAAGDRPASHRGADSRYAARLSGYDRRLQSSIARAEGMPVVHVYVSRRPIELERSLAGPKVAASTRHRVSQNVQTDVRDIPDRLAGSPQAEVPATLVAPDDVHVTTKKSLDGFLDTDLDILLRRILRAETVVVTGINTDTCVYSTTFAASNRGYAPIVISDCVASMRGKDAHWMALELMSRSIAWVLSVDEFKQKVRSSALISAGGNRAG